MEISLVLIYLYTVINIIYDRSSNPKSVDVLAKIYNETISEEDREVVISDIVQL